MDHSKLMYLSYSREKSHCCNKFRIPEFSLLNKVAEKEMFNTLVVDAVLGEEIAAEYYR